MMTTTFRCGQRGSGGRKTGRVGRETKSTEADKNRSREEINNTAVKKCLEQPGSRSFAEKVVFVEVEGYRKTGSRSRLGEVTDGSTVDGRRGEGYGNVLCTPVLLGTGHRNGRSGRKGGWAGPGRGRGAGRHIS